MGTEEVSVAALVRLEVEPAAAAGVGGLGRAPLGAAARQLDLGDVIVAAGGDVQFDLIAIAHEGE